VNKERAYPCYEIPVPKLRKASALLLAESRNELYSSSKTKAYRGQVYYGTGA
jgi:hypothetical protein